MRFKLSKRLGQHFIIDKKILKREVEYAGLCKKDTVLEIGAGDGRLTELLARKAKKVIAIEKDRRLANFLKQKFEGTNVEVICEDALRIEFPSFNKIVSNIPFKISSPLTEKLFNYEWQLAILSYQKEFAERLVAKPGEKNYSRITLLVNYFCEVELLEIVPKEKFFPKPKVDATIIRLKRKEVEPLEKEFWEFVKKIFQYKKKLVKNSLEHSKFSTRLPENLAKKRVFQCSFEELKEIYNFVKEKSL
jgi:16S rRNA (adenine1518-N6/adenine1519-N6)-dimethyltransferase